MAGMNSSSLGTIGMRAGGGGTQRVRWEARRGARRLGWAGLVSIVALAFTAVAAWQGQKLKQREVQLQRQFKAMLSAKPVAPPVDSVVEAGRQITAFYAYLPRHDMISEQLKQLVSIATKNGIVLAKADYKAQPQDGADFLRYQITLPIKTNHVQVQAFILAALQGLPTLTLDSVTFKRNGAEAVEVEARVQFVLLVRKAVPKGARQ